jgi:radical SAM/Cys-rich protein
VTSNLPSTWVNERMSFDAALMNVGAYPLRAETVETLQVNMGPLCNQSCAHCHVEGGPSREEATPRRVLERCASVAERSGIDTVELTGGAPELSPDFKWFVRACRDRGRRVVHRTNLTAMLEPGLEDLPDFLRRNGVEIVASLPCYTRENVDRQRGEGVYDRSIEVLRGLNRIGYGMPGSPLVLDLVFNPGGAFLPPDQRRLESAYRHALAEEHGIEFDTLYAIANMPIGRFARSLREDAGHGGYMKLLRDSFNPQAVERVMCRSLVSVGWDGTLYDCDFNQMLGLPCGNGASRNMREYDHETMKTRRIATAPHCFGCTAGQGSSCCGALDAGA